MKRDGLLAIGAVAVAALLAGCGGSPTPTPTATISAPPEPEPTPTESSAPPVAERDAASPLDRFDAYLACRTLSASFFTGPEGAWDFGAIEYAPIDAADVLPRSDDLWYVYIEVVNGNGTSDATRDVAAECIVGGTLGEPRYELFGARTRAPQSERDPDAPLPTD
jgi:hypothetical protein